MKIVVVGLRYAVLCAERAVGGGPLAVLLADDFLTDYKPGVKTDLAQAFKTSGKSQLSVMGVDRPNISKYEVVVPNGAGAGIVGLVFEKPDSNDAPSNLASIGRLDARSGGEIQLADAINIHAQHGSVETVRLYGRRFDCVSVEDFMTASVYEFEKRSTI